MLTNEQFLSVLKGAGLAAVGAVAAFLVQYLGGLDLGVYGPFVGALLSVLANVGRKAVTAPTDPPSLPPAPEDYGDA